jgi:hypothetical protein
MPGRESRIGSQVWMGRWPVLCYGCDILSKGLLSKLPGQKRLITSLNCMRH